MRGNNDNQLQFSFLPTMVPQGDGSMLIKPGKPVQKLTLGKAAKVIRKSYASAWRLYNAGLLEGEKSTPHGIRIYANSLNAHMQASRDPEMWDNASRLSQYKASLS
jgi:hypothetical protein